MVTEKDIFRSRFLQPFSISPAHATRPAYLIFCD